MLAYGRRGASVSVAIKKVLAGWLAVSAGILAFGMEAFRRASRPMRMREAGLLLNNGSKL
ncbi:hypothetical protein CHH28_18875 [Bacterioplanes sanyensis]|uniref:Uncharacterized protein n=1 Tax=Bacterioplanes sanyensis TaxID=1249553 RepID=A0A222FQ09_9GAMM|nr:hypothetical protein CHH28_18875 [Bacterioplanes sanyensis]